MTESELRNTETSIASFVGARIASIQNDYLSSNNRSRGARRLAVLRHAMMTPIGLNADAWPLEFEGLPSSLVGRGAEPSPGEIAVHGTLTLYAFHQQGQTVPMHVPGRENGLGNAVRRFVMHDKDRFANLETGEMPRKFRALITAESMEETLHYARQIVQQLRGASIPLDYARLAVQLFNLQNPYIADSVRLAWGRGYAFAGRDDSENPTVQ